MTHYRPQFTPNGHSIRLLKDRASTLKTAQGCSYNEALDEIARSIGYSNWAAISAEPADPKRDDFFSQSYQLNQDKRPGYREFLITQGLEASPDTFRQFLVDDYAFFKSLGFHHYELSREPGDARELIRELSDFVRSHGAQGLLPQMLTDELLERLIGHTRLAFAHIQHPGGLSLPPTRNLDPIAECVACIVRHQQMQRNPRASSVNLRPEQLLERIQCYRVRLELEFLSRRTKVKFEHCTQAAVLVPAESVLVRFADE